MIEMMLLRHITIIITMIITQQQQMREKEMVVIDNRRCVGDATLSNPYMSDANPWLAESWHHERGRYRWKGADMRCALGQRLTVPSVLSCLRLSRCKAQRQLFHRQRL